MSEENLSEAELEAKRLMESAIQDLTRAAQGTTLLPVLGTQLMVMTLDALVEMLTASKLVDKAGLYQRITAKVESMATECRRAILAAGGASALAGLRKPQ